MRLLIAAIALSLGVVACNKPGTGGKAKLNIHVIDGDNNSPYTEVQIKYGATGFPGEGASYDDIDTTDHTGKATFGNLKKGAYYIYAVGARDSLGNAVVHGGAKARITNRIGEQHIVIDFSESDPF